MSELKRDEEENKEAKPVLQSKSIWKESHPIVIVARKLAFLRFIKWPLLIFIIYGSLNYSGFCFKDMRYISDDEKIQMLIEDINRGIYSHDRRYFGASGKLYVQIKNIPYESVDAFLKENPNCCTLVKKSEDYGKYFTPNFWQRIFGDYSYAIRVKYIQKYIEMPFDENDKKGMEKVQTSFVEAFYPANNCGGHCSCFVTN